MVSLDFGDTFRFGMAHPLAQRPEGHQGDAAMRVLQPRRGRALRRVVGQHRRPGEGRGRRRPGDADRVPRGAPRARGVCGVLCAVRVLWDVPAMCAM